jgi:hypothetical protein
MLSITITDDGIGIDPANANGSPHGSGLRGIIRRLTDLGGLFAVLPVSTGSAFDIRIPLVADTNSNDDVAIDKPHIRGVPPPSGGSYSERADAAQRMVDRS